VRVPVVLVVGCLLLGAGPALADRECDDGSLVGPPRSDRAAVARTAGRDAGLLGVQRATSVQSVRVADGARPWVRVEAPRGFGLVSFGHSFGGEADALLVDDSGGGCSSLRLQAVDASSGRTRWVARVAVPDVEGETTGWLVPQVADLTGDGLDDAVVEVRTAAGDNRVRNADGRLEGGSGTGGAVHLVDGASGRVALLASQAPSGAGPFAGGSGPLTLVGTTASPGAADVVARRAGRVVWRASPAVQGGAPLLRSSRVGPVLATSEAVLPGRPGAGVTHEVVQLDGATGRVVWRRSWTDRGQLDVLQSGGDLLVRLGGLGRVEAVSAVDGATRWRTDDDLLAGERLVGDLDRDGAEDVYVPGSLGTTAVLSGRTGAALHPAVLSHATGDATSLGDVDGDGHGDLLTTLREQDPRELLLGGGADVPEGLTALSGRTGAVLWTTGERPASLGVVTGRVRPGRGPDVFLHDLDTGRITLRAGATGVAVWDRDLDD
jgi:hypothetical protein